MKLTRLLLSTLLCSTLLACGSDVQEDPVTTTDLTGEKATQDIAVTAQPTEKIEVESDTEGTQSNSENLPSSLSLVRNQWTGDLDGMLERRVIRVLTVYGAGRYYLDNGEEKGIVAEVMGRFEDAVNDSMDNGHVRVHVIVIPVARDQLIPALLEGKGDIASAGLSITPERLTEVDFSIPSSKPLSEILVTGPSAPPLETIEDLSGQTVHVRVSSSYRMSLENLNERLVAQEKEPVVIEPMSELLEDDDLIEMVNAGLLPWVIVDEYKPQLWDGVFTNLTVRNDIVFREGGRIAWAFRKNSPQLASAANAFLRKNREGTMIGNIMRNRYIRDFDWAANALSSDEYARFEELESIFRTYGEQYGIEYLLAAAQGYQESRLDQSVRSGAGAVGVMQLLPSTASDDKVDIDNIHEVDANIHAGIKYLHYLRDRYFDDPDIDQLNQTLLALAAYNAGPARMINLRAKAEAQGYNPNMWFDNVELIAAKEIGRETVQYVANIFKYYLSYRMVAMQALKRQAAREAVGIDAIPEGNNGN
ncbi:MAG: transglycosylase SLT domain-containing protein [Halioglobus sp.]